MRIRFVNITQESNDFNPLLTTVDDYRANTIQRGAELNTYNKNGQHAGYLEAVAESGLRSRWSCRSSGEAMLRLGIKGKALVPIIAPKAIARLHEAGEGATVTLKPGGETATHFIPLEVTGAARKLQNKLPRFRSGTVFMGRSAIFELGPVTMLITEFRGAGGNLPALYAGHGVNVADMAVMRRRLPSITSTGTAPR